MITLDASEWASLKSSPAFNKLLNDLNNELQGIATLMAAGALLDADNEHSTAMNYALNVGKTQVLAEIIEYKPQMEEDEDNG